MKPLLLFLSLLSFCNHAFTQKREAYFNYSFKPTKNEGPFYYVITQKKDSGWYREAYYLSQRSLAMKGWYKDEEATLPDGLMEWYHPTRILRSKGLYSNGKQEGLWVGYDEKGNMTDSSNFKAGHRTGIAMHWHSNGMPRDSLNFDGNGNGVEVSWYDDGVFASAGHWTGDTIKTGRWKYYHKNGTVMATEDYVGGKLSVCNCYDEKGQALDSALCREKEAEPAGGLKRWQLFLERGLQSMLEAKAKSQEWSAGQHTVAIRFVVEKDGSLSEFKALTDYGGGMEDEVIKLLERSPRWTPGRQWGQPVRSYHTQPLTFVIEEK